MAEKGLEYFVSAFLFSYDRLTILLAPFLLILMGRAVFLRHMSAFVSAFCALLFLFFFNSFLGVFSLGMMLFMGSVALGAPFGSISLPFLMGYALFPSFWTESGVIGCLLCPLLKKPDILGKDEFSFLILLMALRLSGYFLDMPSLFSGRLFFFVLFGMMAGSIVSFLWQKTEERKADLLFSCGDMLLLWRPLFLMAFIKVASENSLNETIEAAYIALFMDILVRFLRVFSKSSLFFQALIPPFPGFLMLFLCLHTLLGLATISSLWMMLSFLMMCFFILLFLGEMTFIASLSYRFSLLGYFFKKPFSLWGGICAIPICGSLMSAFLTQSLPDLGDIGAWGRKLCFVKAGDGATLSLPILWSVFLILFLWCKKSSLAPIREHYSDYYGFFAPWFWGMERIMGGMNMLEEKFIFQIKYSLNAPLIAIKEAFKVHLGGYYQEFLEGREKQLPLNFSLILWLCFLAVILIWVGSEQ